MKETKRKEPSLWPIGLKKTSNDVDHGPCNIPIVPRTWKIKNLKYINMNQKII